MRINYKPEREEKQAVEKKVGTFGIKIIGGKFWDRVKEIKANNNDADIKGILQNLGAQPYTGYWLYDIYSQNGEPIGRLPVRSSHTLKKLFSFALRRGYAVLNRGFFAIPQAVWEDYKKSYKKGDFEGNLRIGLQVFKEQRLTRLAPYVLMDFDNTPEEDIKRLVKYLHKVGIYPDVWQSASGKGYHIYIKLVGALRTTYAEIENDDKEKKKIALRHYFLPYASDYRILLCIKALGQLCKRLNLKADFISVRHAVWEEGLPNPLKGGKSSEKVFDGYPHRLDKLTEKLRPLWEASLREEAREKYQKQVLQKPKKKKQEERGYASIEIQASASSNPIDYLQANISTAFRMLDRGYTWAEIEEELRDHWEGDHKAFDRAFKGFRDWIEDYYKPPTRARRKPPKQRKHKHYWEYVDAIYEVLRQNPQASIREIAKATGIPKSSVGDVLKLFTREQILTDPEQVKEYLRANEKGGDKLTERAREELREIRKERFRRYFEEVLRQALSPKPKTKERENRIQDSITYNEAILDLSDQETVRIGHISITPPLLGEESRGEGGLCVLPPKPPTREKFEGVMLKVPESKKSPVEKAPCGIQGEGERGKETPTGQETAPREPLDRLLELVRETLAEEPPPHKVAELLRSRIIKSELKPSLVWVKVTQECYETLLRRDIASKGEDGRIRLNTEKMERDKPLLVKALAPIVQDLLQKNSETTQRFIPHHRR